MQNDFDFRIILSSHQKNFNTKNWKISVNGGRLTYENKLITGTGVYYLDFNENELIDLHEMLTDFNLEKLKLKKVDKNDFTEWLSLFIDYTSLNINLEESDKMIFSKKSRKKVEKIIYYLKSLAELKIANSNNKMAKI